MHPLVKLAKEAVENYIKDKKIISIPKDFPEEFSKKKSGVFVTIMKNGNLRGCIGTYLPTRENIAKEVIFNAISAATEDWRFGPIKIEELLYLSYTVYILSELKLVKNIKELNPKKYGVIIKTVPISESGDVILDGHFVPKTGLLLPDLEGVDSVEKQILITCQKAGIDPEREKFLIYKFTVEKYQ
jgi:AmmeMemoRadiSam system protein A